MSKTETSDDAMHSPVNLAGVIVSCRPENADAVEGRLNALTGTEVHMVSPGGRLIVTVEEAPGSQTLTDTLSDMQHVPDVIDVSLVYSHSDDALTRSQEEAS